MNFFESSFKSFFWNIAGAAIAFITQIIAAKYLGAEIYGIANYYLGFVTTITIFTGFGLQFYLPNAISRTKNRKRLFSDIFWTYSFLFMVVQIFLYFLLGKVVGNDFIIIIILAYLTTLSEIILSYNISIGKASQGSFIRKFLYSLFNLVFFIIMIMFVSRKYYSYLITMILAYIITVIPYVIKNVSTPKFNCNILKLSFIYYITQIVYGFYASCSKIIQKQMGTFQSVGILSISMTLGNLINMLGSNFSKLSMPLFSKYWRDGEIDKLRDLYMATTRINCFFILPIAISLIINSGRILSILGKGYNGGEIIFILVMISQFTNSFTGPNGTLIAMTEYSRYEVFNGIIKLFISILAVVILGNKFIWTVPFSLAFSEIMVNIIKTIQVKIKIGIFPYKFKDIVYILILVIIESLFLVSISNINNIILWGISNGIIISIAAILSFYQSPNKEDRLFAKNIILKFKQIFLCNKIKY